MGGDPEVPAVSDERLGVIALVGGDGPPAGSGREPFEQLESGCSFGVAVGLGELGVDGPCALNLGSTRGVSIPR